MKINNLLRSPFVNLIGMVLLLYFLFENSKNNPRSIAHQLSEKKIKDNISAFGETVNKFNQLKSANSSEKIQTESTQNNGNLEFKEVESGKGSDFISCGDEVEISYSAYDESGHELDRSDSLKFIIGSNKNPFFEKNILNLKLGAIKFIKIPKNYKIQDYAVSKIVNSQNLELKFLINIKEIRKSKSNEIHCLV